MTANSSELAGWGVFGGLWTISSSGLAMLAQADSPNLGTISQIGGTVAVASGVGTVVAMAITAFGNSIFKPWLETRANTKLIESLTTQVGVLTTDRDKYKVTSEAFGETNVELARKINVLTEKNVLLASSMLVQLGRIKPLAEGAGLVGDAPPTLDGPRVLLVEDEPIARVNMAALLELLGHCRVAVAATFAEGIAALGSVPPPDFAILDLRLPDGDGTDLLRIIKDRQIPTRVIVTTGQSAEQVAGVRALGALAVLRKPVDVPNDLLPLILRPVVVVATAPPVASAPGTAAP